MTPAPVRSPRLFLDANVLISAAWKPGSKVLRIWAIPNADLVTSDYVVGECKRNLPREEQKLRFATLLQSVRLLEFAVEPLLAERPQLPDKDQPVLAAAVLSRADFLVTGDIRHFGQWYGKTVFGIRVEPPGRFPAVLEERRDNEP